MNESLQSGVKEFTRFVKFVTRNFIRHKGLENAKALTYMSLFAVIPLLTLVAAILSAFPAFQVFGNQVQGMIFDRLLPSSSSELEAYFNSFSTQARNLTWVGALMLVVTAFLMLTNIERSFNRIWEVRESRRGLNSFLLYWSVMSLGPILLGLGFAISSYITSLNLFDSFLDISESLGTTSFFLGLFPVLLTTGAFTLLYIAVPNCGVRLRHAFIGGLAVAISFMLVKQLFTWFISLASYQFVYGTFAAVPIFLMWIYICWAVILLGANLVRSLPAYSVKYRGGSVHPAILVMALLHKFWIRQQHGRPVHMSELIKDRWPFNELSLAECIKVLEENRIIRSCSVEEYLLIRDLGGLSLQDIFNWFQFSYPAEEDFKAVPELIAQELPGLDYLRERFGRIESASKQELGGSIAAVYEKAGPESDS